MYIKGFTFHEKRAQKRAKQADAERKSPIFTNINLSTRARTGRTVGKHCSSFSQRGAHVAGTGSRSDHYRPAVYLSFVDKFIGLGPAVRDRTRGGGIPSSINRPIPANRLDYLLTHLRVRGLPESSGGPRTQTTPFYGRFIGRISRKLIKSRPSISNLVGADIIHSIEMARQDCQESNFQRLYRIFCDIFF